MMLSGYCIIQGYGLKNVFEYLNTVGKELIEEDNFEFVKALNDPRGLLVGHIGEDIGCAIGVNICYPFEKTPFNTRKECEDYIYDSLYKFLSDKYKQSKDSLVFDINYYEDVDFF